MRIWSFKKISLKEMEVALEGASLVTWSPIGKLLTVQIGNDEYLHRTEMEGVERRRERGEVEK